MYLCLQIDVGGTSVFLFNGIMDFYDRENELVLLAETEALSEHSARMTVIVGRRRVGKTSLAKKAFEGRPFLYFFVARKAESLLCQEFVDEIEFGLKKPVPGEFRSFIKLFEYLLIISQSEPFTLIIDEFQEFYQINDHVYSEMQNLWDRYKSTSKMNLILSGSVYSLMKKIFENAKEPLFGRANERIHLKPFSVEVIKTIVTDHRRACKPLDLLAFYIFTGGVAKNVGMVKAMETVLGMPVLVPEEPLITGALGAAILARDQAFRLVQDGRLEMKKKELSEAYIDFVEKDR